MGSKGFIKDTSFLSAQRTFQPLKAPLCPCGLEYLPPTASVAGALMTLACPHHAEAAHLWKGFIYFCQASNATVSLKMPKSTAMSEC